MTAIDESTPPVSAPKPPAGSRLSRSGPAKFTRPRNPEGVVPRARLNTLLDAAAGTPLTLIVGPAGYGKSTLVSHWLRQSEQSYAWMFADEHDADPNKLTRSIIGAVARAHPALIPQSIESLGNEHASFQQLLMTFADEMSRVEPPFMIVIDDYDRAHSSETDALLSLLLQTIGESPSLMLISRSMPNLPFDMLRAYGELTNLGVTDLRFTQSEAHALLQQMQSNELTTDVEETIVERADGWAVGLRLLACATNPATLLPQTGVRPLDRAPNPQTANYLFAEVIDQQPADVQNFLIRTSILEQLAPDLCFAVSGRADSRKVLDSLVERGLFTEVVDHSGPSFRYHPLFRDALTVKLHRDCPASEIDALHRAAAARYEAAGIFEWATHHRMLAQDWEQALALVHEQVSGWMLDDQLTSIDTWTSRFDLSVLLRDPLLTFCRGWTLARLGRTVEAEELVKLAQRSADELDDRYFQLRLDVISTYVHMLRGEWAAGQRIAHRWLDAMPAVGTLEHLALLMFDVLMELFAGRPTQASIALDKPRKLIESSGRVWIDALEVVYRGRILNEQGQNTKAKAVYREAVHLGERANAQPLHYAHLVLSQAYLESMELRSARSNALRCLDLASTIGTAVHTSPALQVLADVANVRGDRHEAEQHIRQAIMIARRYALTYQVVEAEARQAHYLIAAGDTEGAEAWANDRLHQDRRLNDHQRYKENSVLARYLIVTGRFAEAQGIISALYAQARAENRRRNECEMAVLSALSRWRSGDVLGALAQFRPALRQSSDNQWVFQLAQDIQLLAPMLERLADDPEIGGFVSSLLRDRRDRLHMRVVLDSTGSPLTPREREMLSGLMTGKSNRELADEMFISEYTVKRHLSNLYTKLGVSSRAQAISFFANRGDS